MDKVFPLRPCSFDVALSSQVLTSQLDASFYWRVVVPLEQNSNPYSESKRLFKNHESGL